MARSERRVVVTSVCYTRVPAAMYTCTGGYVWVCLPPFARLLASSKEARLPGALYTCTYRNVALLYRLLSTVYQLQRTLLPATRSTFSGCNVVYCCILLYILCCTMRYNRACGAHAWQHRLGNSSIPTSA